MFFSALESFDSSMTEDEVSPFSLILSNALPITLLLFFLRIQVHNSL